MTLLLLSSSIGLVIIVTVEQFLPGGGPQWPQALGTTDHPDHNTLPLRGMIKAPLKSVVGSTGLALTGAQFDRVAYRVTVAGAICAKSENAPS